MTQDLSSNSCTISDTMINNMQDPLKPKLSKNCNTQVEVVKSINNLCLTQQRGQQPRCLIATEKMTYKSLACCRTHWWIDNSKGSKCTTELSII